MKRQFNVLFLLIIVSAIILSACGGGGAELAATEAGPVGDPVAGKTAYESTCIACHGADLKGMTGLGKDLTTSEFVKSQTDEQMVAFILVGRPASDPANTQGVDMPPKGGNPALTDDDLLNIVAYIRSTQAP